jgi:tape measure domain-containing protein
MATSSRDVELGIAVKASGNEQVTKLREDILALARDGGASAQDVQRLADELDRLARLDAAVTALQRLQDESKQLAAAQEAAAAAAKGAAERLAEQAQAAQAAAAAQASGAEALQGAIARQREMRDELARLKAGLDDTGKSEEAQKARIAELTGARIEQRAEIERLREQLRQLTAESNAAERAQANLIRASTAAARASEQASQAVAANAQALREAGGDLTLLGESTTDLASAQARLVQGFGAVEAAADTLVTSVAKASEQERELAEMRAFQKVADDAVRAQRAAEYVRFWTEALASAEQQERETAEEAKRAASATEESGRRMSAAFSATGATSVAELQRQIAGVRTSMALLASSGQVTGRELAVAFEQGEARIRDLEREIRRATDALTVADKAADLFKNSLGQIAAGNVIADAVGYLVNKVKELGREFITTIANTEALRRGLTAVYGSMTTAAVQMGFLTATALRAGVAVGEIEQSFLKFSAATRAAGLPLSQTNELFAEVTRTAGLLGLKSQDVAGILEALGQMASKGVVSMEELRQQLGDRLPGALSRVAQGLEISESQLIKLVESGQLAARDLFPALTRGLASMQGEAESLTGTWANFKTILTGVAQDAGDAGWTVLLTGAIKLLGGTVGAVALALSTLQEGMFLSGKAALALFKTLRGNGTQAFAFFAEEVDKANLRLEKQALRLDALLDPTGAAAKKLREMGEAQGAAASASTGLVEASDRVANVSVSSAAGIELVAKQAEIAASKTSDLSAQHVKFGVEVGELLPKLEAQSVALDKIARATEISGASTTRLAQMTGFERDALAAATAAAEANATAQERAAAAHQAELDVLVVQRAELIENARQRGLTKQQIDQELTALDNKIAKSRGETEQSRAAAAAALDEVAQRKVSQKSYEDNSAAIETFRQAAVQAQAAVERLRLGLVDGSVTQAQYDQGVRDAKVALALYNDSLRDSTVKIGALSRVQQAGYNVELAGLSVRQQAVSQLAAAARALGDSAQATYYEIEAKRTQIQITRLTAQAKKAEADATILAANAELEHLQKTNSLTEVKRLEIEARLANAKAKQIEAGASESVIRAIEMEIKSLRERGSTQEYSTGTIDADTNARYRNIDAIHAQQEANRGLQDTQGGTAGGLPGAGFGNGMRKGSQPGTYVDSSGVERRKSDGAPTGTFTNTLPTDMAAEVMRRGAGAFGPQDIPMLQEAKSQALVALQQLGNISKLSPGAVSTKAMTDAQSLVSATTAALDRAQKQQSVNERVHKVDINLGGRSTPITVGGEQDANNLIGIFRQLEQHKGTMQ